MEKIKTLKDLEKEFSNESDITLINTMFLRQEAIKIIKYYEDLLLDQKPTGIKYKDEFIRGSRIGAISIITEFFNISEEMENVKD